MKSLILIVLTVVTSAVALVALSVADSGPTDGHAIWLDEAEPNRTYPGWRQVNNPGFGDPQNVMVQALAVFGSHLYAGTTNDSGAQVWRHSGGTTWSNVSPSWSVSNTGVMDLEVFASRLYAATANNNGGEIWRTSNGTTWEQVAAGGFGDTGSIYISRLAVFGSYIYAVVSGWSEATGQPVPMRIYRSATGNSGTWVRVDNGGTWGQGVAPDVVADVFNGNLYLGLSRSGRSELWRTNNGTTWTPMFTNCLGTGSSHISAMQAKPDRLYIGLRNTTTGGQVWQSYNGLVWLPVITDGLGTRNNARPYGLTALGDDLYLIFSNFATGAEVWRSRSGGAWQPVAQGGWGDGSVSWADYFDKASAVFNNRLYVAAWPPEGGAEIWRTAITADFTASPTSGDPPLVVTFTNRSVGDYTSSLWQFGDGITSTLATPTHTYTASGVYTVSLTISDGVETSTRTRPSYIRVRYRVFLPIQIANWTPRLSEHSSDTIVRWHDP